MRLGAILSLFLFVASSHAAVKDINAARLPQLSALPKVLADIAELEPYVTNWTTHNDWPYPVPRKTVVSRMKDNLKVLEKALKEYPDNLELLLLTALAGHYAYNVDVDSANDLVRQSLERAHALAPDDARVTWFRDIHLCQANFVDLAMTDFLRLENSPAAAQLPTTFWEDYMACALLANMPAHLLRASIRVPETKRTDLTRLWIERAEKRLITPNPHSSYKPEQVWANTKSEAGPRFMSSLCGVAFSARADWKLSFPDPGAGQCLAQVETGPYPARGREVIPNILLLVRPPKAGETLEDFLKSFLKYPNSKEIPVGSCPETPCLAAEAFVQDRYKESGGGHAIFTVFERDEPQFPGIMFEAPAGPKVPSDSAVHSYPPVEHLKRLNGKLYYMVLLDSADSVLDAAKADYEAYLKSMKVE